MYVDVLLLLMNECLLSSWCHVLFVPHVNSDDVGNRSPGLPGCCEHVFTLLQQIFMCLQVFYGRYLKKLSNQTQEAMGEMTKVSSSVSFPSFVYILIHARLHKRRSRLCGRFNHSMRATKRKASSTRR